MKTSYLWVSSRTLMNEYDGKKVEIVVKYTVILIL